MYKHCEERKWIMNYLTFQLSTVYFTWAICLLSNFLTLFSIHTLLEIQGSKTDAIWLCRTTLFWCPKLNLSFHFFWMCSHYYWLSQSLAETLKVYLDASSPVKIASVPLMWAPPHVCTPLPPLSPRFFCCCCFVFNRNTLSSRPPY